jgi:hypothetical protein
LVSKRKRGLIKDHMMRDDDLVSGCLGSNILYDE